jgi:hypothetical protein
MWLAGLFAGEVLTDPVNIHICELELMTFNCLNVTPLASDMMASPYVYPFTPG